MAILAALLAVGVFVYMGVRWRTTTLTRFCRWRQDRTIGVWRCAYCGGTVEGDAPPKVCVRRG